MTEPIKECDGCDQLDCPFVENPKPSHQVIVRNWTSYGELTVDIGKKTYTFFGVERHHYKKIQDMIRKRYHGRVIQYLKCHHSMPERIGKD